MNIEFVAPALKDITSTAYFSDEEVVGMNSALESMGRNRFESKLDIKDSDNQLVAQAVGGYVVGEFGK